jgi:hypothetical protein
MNNIARCSKCNKEFIAEEIETHEKECIITVKEIPISFFFVKNKQNREIIIAKGKDDGILYRLVKTSTSSSDDSLQPNKSNQSDDKFTEPKSIYLK